MNPATLLAKGGLKIAGSNAAASKIQTPPLAPAPAPVPAPGPATMHPPAPTPPLFFFEKNAASVVFFVICRIDAPPSPC